MMNDINKTDYTVLFVDDEPKTLKNFTKVMKSKYHVLTAENSTEAKKILDSHSDEIAVLITDQRMPGGSGVELLTYAHQQYPSIVRLLTTAYSDLSDTIDAINEGEIFRYIIKPWDIYALQADIQAAMTFFNLRKDRDILIKEKLSVLTQSTMIDRICRTIVLGHCQSELRFIPQALQAFLVTLLEQQSLSSTNNSIKDYWHSVVTETQHMACVAQHTSSLLKTVSEQNFFNDDISQKTWQEILKSLSGLDYCNQFDIENVTNIIGNIEKLKIISKSIVFLLDNYQRPDTSINVQVVNNENTPSLQLLIEAKNMPVLIEEKNRILDINNDNSVDERIFALWLTIFLLTYDHGGKVELEITDKSTVIMKLSLPDNASFVTEPDISSEWIEDIFVNYTS